MSEIYFTPLGGANEVGASSYLLNIRNYNILLDAGIRVNRKGKDMLPDLEKLPAKLDLVLFSHAHMDHMGALPVVFRRNPEALYYTTHPSKLLSAILLRDSLKLMQLEKESDKKLPLLFTEDELKQSLWRLEAVSFEEWFEPVKGIKVYFHPAGHIMGASSILIHDTEKDIKILYSGDISIANQKTVSGAILPSKELISNINLLILESTYGGGKHPKRQDEESKLAHNVGEVIEQGGAVLIPAFALGRAQEIILILRDHILGKKIPPFPVYVDGMVRTICDLYTELPDYLPDKIKNYIRNSRQPVFWNEGPSAPARVIKGNKETRTEALLRPCCIISSSGMMVGGPSVWYAKQLLDNKKNAIFITGYQDEESPGRRLLELKTGENIILNDETFEVKCKVTRYHLSAHADQGQLCQWISNIKPQAIILIHGDPPSIQALRTKLIEKYTVWNPKNGETLSPLVKPGWMTEKLKTVLESKDVRYRAKMETGGGEVIIKVDTSIKEDPMWQQYYASYPFMELKWHGTRLILKGVPEDNQD